MAQAKVAPAPYGSQQQGVVGQQPMGGAVAGPPPPIVWMPAVAARVPNCPPGLEYLTAVDQVIVHELLNLAEVLTGFDMCNKYEIKNSLGQNCYFAIEDSGACSRWCLGPSHPFEMKVLDNTNREVMLIQRPYRCTGCCYPCCLQTLTVESPPGVVIGRVDQDWTCCAPEYSVCDPEGNVILRIDGPGCMCPACGADVVFHIKSADGATEVGQITRQWPGFVNQYFTNVENFGVSFPMDLDVKCKATLLGATFLIDFMFFEQNARPNRRRHHHHH